MNLARLCILCFAVMILTSCQKELNFETEGVDITGTVKITIKHTVNGVPLQLSGPSYTNVFGEQYTVSKLKYYISNIKAVNSISPELTGDYYLVDAGKPGSLSFTFKADVSTYTSIVFLLGVDSARNVSGAQTGALDPLNDMFWTWNTGYIMAKLEGNSPQSTLVNNKIEYHIGGFAGPDAVPEFIALTPAPTLDVIDVRAGEVTEIFIEADVDAWWQGPYDLRITNEPTITTPGATAKNIANNYSRMFTITNIINH